MSLQVREPVPSAWKFLQVMFTSAEIEEGADRQSLFEVPINYLGNCKQNRSKSCLGQSRRDKFYKLMGFLMGHFRPRGLLDLERHGTYKFYGKMEVTPIHFLTEWRCYYRKLSHLESLLVVGGKHVLPGNLFGSRIS